MIKALSFGDYLTWLETNEPPTEFNRAYHATHAKRFGHTVELLEQIKGSSVLEVGATDYFQLVFKTLGYTDIWGSIFDSDAEKKLYKRGVAAAGVTCETTAVSVNIECELYPVAAGHFDTILFGEVLEHLDIDPMFALVEFNRILKQRGKLVLTTPNCCSARNTWKILQGYRPHFFMQYEKIRSPYRHNFEHDVHSVSLLLHSAGFKINSIFTLDVFEEPLPAAIGFLQKSGFTTEHRGDDIFVVAEKVSPVTDRWPYGIYV